MQTGGKGKRELILQAAAEVFIRDGYHLAKVEDIAMVAGVGKGTVYEYFASKSELFQEMFKDSFLSFMEELRSAAAVSGKASEKLRQLAILHLNNIVRSRDLARITMDNHCQFGADFRHWMHDIQVQKLAILQGVIEEGIQSGEFREVDSKTTAIVFTGAVAALFGPVTFGNMQVDKDKVIKETMDLLLNGLTKN